MGTQLKQKFLRKIFIVMFIGDISDQEPGVEGGVGIFRALPAGIENCGENMIYIEAPYEYGRNLDFICSDKN